MLQFTAIARCQIVRIKRTIPIEAAIQHVTNTKDVVVEHFDTTNSRVARKFTKASQEEQFNPMLPRPNSEEYMSDGSNKLMDIAAERYRFGRPTGVILGGQQLRNPRPLYNQDGSRSTTPPLPEPLTHETVQQQLMSLPNGIDRLYTGFYFDVPIDSSGLPKSLQRLEFGAFFSQHLETVLLPQGLKKLNFGGWNRPVSELAGLKLLSHLESLTFGHDFNQPIPQSIDFLPPQLLELEFGSQFSQPVENLLLPASLRSLRFGCCFNSSLDRLLLPSHLQRLHLGEFFAQPLLHWNPPATLTDFVLGYQWNCASSQLKLPPRLQAFQFPAEFRPATVDSCRDISLPASITLLQFGTSEEWPTSAQPAGPMRPCGRFNLPLQSLALPSQLRRLHLSPWFNHPLSGMSWPSSLTHLTFSYAFQQPLRRGDLPSTLLVLDMSNCVNWNLPLKDNLHLPSSLERLHLPLRHQLPLDNLPLTFWPNSLHVLVMDDQSDSLMNWTPPRQLKFLQMGSGWNLPARQLNLSLTSSLLCLVLLDSFNNSVDGLILPRCLRSLRINSYTFNQPVASLQLPQELEELQIGSDVSRGHKPPRSNCGSFNQSLRGLALPDRLQRLYLPTFAFAQPRHELPARLPTNLRILRLHSPARMTASGWNEMQIEAPFPPVLRIEFGEPKEIHHTRHLTVNELSQS